MGKLIYVASPLTHPDPAVRQRRFETVQDYVGRKFAEGSQDMYFSPIMYSHEIGKHFNLPHDAEFWKNMDHLMLSRCDKLEVLKIEGWEKSVGVRMEMDYWESLPGQRPISFIFNDIPTSTWITR